MFKANLEPDCVKKCVHTLTLTTKFKKAGEISEPTATDPPLFKIDLFRSESCQILHSGQGKQGEDAV